MIIRPQIKHKHKTGSQQNKQHGIQRFRSTNPRPWFPRRRGPTRRGTSCCCLPSASRSPSWSSSALSSASRRSCPGAPRRTPSPPWVGLEPKGDAFIIGSFCSRSLPSIPVFFNQGEMRRSFKSSSKIDATLSIIIQCCPFFSNAVIFASTHHDI